MKKLVLALLLVLSCNVIAGNQAGKVSSVLVRASDGLVYFTITGQANDKPACATHSYWMIKDEASGAGKQQYAMVLAAQASGKTIYVDGMNSCSRWGDGEDVNYIRISN